MCSWSALRPHQSNCKFSRHNIRVIFRKYVYPICNLHASSKHISVVCAIGSAVFCTTSIIMAPIECLTCALQSSEYLRSFGNKFLTMGPIQTSNKWYAKIYSPRMFGLDRGVLVKHCRGHLLMKGMSLPSPLFTIGHEGKCPIPS
jgi:hypothetical protein